VNLLYRRSKFAILQDRLGLDTRSLDHRASAHLAGHLLDDIASRPIHIATYENMNNGVAITGDSSPGAPTGCSCSINWRQ